MDDTDQKAIADDSEQQTTDPRLAFLLRLYAAMMPPLTTALLLSDGLGEFDHWNRYTLSNVRREEAAIVLGAALPYTVTYMGLTSKKAAQQQGWLVKGLRYGFNELGPNFIYGSWVSVALMKSLGQVSAGLTDATQVHFSADSMRLDVGVGFAAGAVYALTDAVVQSRAGTLGKLDGSPVMSLGHGAMIGLTMVDDAAAIASFLGAEVPAAMVGVGALISAAGVVGAQMTCASGSFFNPAKYSCYVPWELNMVARLGITVCTGQAATGYPAAKFGLMAVMGAGFGVRALISTCCHRTAHPAAMDENGTDDPDTSVEAEAGAGAGAGAYVLMGASSSDRDGQLAEPLV